MNGIDERKKANIMVQKYWLENNIKPELNGVNSIKERKRTTIYAVWMSHTSPSLKYE